MKGLRLLAAFLAGTLCGDGFAPLNENYIFACVVLIELWAVCELKGYLAQAIGGIAAVLAAVPLTYFVITLMDGVNT